MIWIGSLQVPWHRAPGGHRARTKFSARLMRSLGAGRVRGQAAAWATRGWARPRVPVACLLQAGPSLFRACPVGLHRMQVDGGKRSSGGGSREATVSFVSSLRKPVEIKLDPMSAITHAPEFPYID